MEKTWECYFCEKTITEESDCNIRKRQPGKYYCGECYPKVKDIPAKDINELKKKYMKTHPKPLCSCKFNCGLCHKDIEGQQYKKCEGSSILVCEKCSGRLIKDEKENHIALRDRIRDELNYYMKVTGNFIDSTISTNIYSAIEKKYKDTDYTYGGMLFTLDYCKLKLGYSKFNEHILGSICNQYYNAKDYSIERAKKRNENKNFKVEPEIIFIKRDKGLSKNKYKHRIKYNMEDLINE